jgi:large subunit ribosomal protein L13
VEAQSYKTIYMNSQSVQKGWVVIDASNAVLGRLASQIAKVLQGKNKPEYTPNVDCGDNVIVINCSNIRFTGKKWTDKQYVRHTGYPGGQRFATPRQIADSKSAGVIIEMAVKGMLPKNRLGRRLFHNLFVYDGAEHPHQAQQPQELKLNF